MLYYFDETADQGYVDKASSLDEYGLLAGWAFPDRNKAVFEAKVAPVLSNFFSCGYKKLHCTELFQGDANNFLRDDLYCLLRSLKEYIIIHEGAYPLGVSQQEQAVRDNLSAHLPEVPVHIRFNSRPGRTRLYTTLLTGVIVKLDECALIEGEPEVHMVSDRIDKTVQEEAAKLLEYLSSSKHTIVRKAYDMQEKQLLTQTMGIEITSPKIRTKIERVKSISFVKEVTPLLFIADFICFELLRHFRRRMKVERPIKFQSPEVLEGFPLKDKVAFQGSNYFTDLVFKPTVGR